MFVMQDNFYEDKNGHIYTEQYLKTVYIKDYESTMRKMTNDEKYAACGWVKCNYAQLFYEDDALILCNNIMNYYNNLELENGDDSVDEVCQFYIIEDGTANYLKQHTDEIIYYWEDLDVYVLGVTHWGTSWDYVGAEYRI